MQKFFTVDARTVLTLGRESIKDHTTAILELVKNSYDAGATVVEVCLNITEGDLNNSSIIISDNGCGMTESEVDENWLRIGFSTKKNKKRTKGRRKIGEKGIGRISADRLGAVLELRSQSKNTKAIGLKVEWDQFDAPGTDLVKVPLLPLKNIEFKIPFPSKFDEATNTYHDFPAPKNNSLARSGTELNISFLRQNWSKDDISELHRELSILTPPYGGVEDFQIRIQNNVTPEFNGVVSSPFYGTAEVEATFTLEANKKIKCEISDRNQKGGLRKAKVTTVPWEDLVHVSQNERNKEISTDNFHIGPVKATFLYFPRASETLRGTNLSLGELRDFLDLNAGVKVYRDNIRVMPYGNLNKSEGGDWLGLGERKTRNPAGAGRKDFRMSPTQLVGAVFLTRDHNPNLVDTSGREGLIHGHHFIVLKDFLIGCILRLEAHYHQLFRNKKESREKNPNPRETVKEFKEDLKQLQKTLGRVKGQFPEKGGREIKTAQEQIVETFSHINKLRQSMEDLAGQATIYRGLATLGIASATFSHETDSALEQFQSSMFAARNILTGKNINVSEAVEELEKSITAGETISAWGKFALRRIKPDKRSRTKINVTDIISDLITELKPAFDASEISIKTRLRFIEGRFFPMDIESVVLNLLTNAYFFAKLLRRKTRAVMVSLSKVRQKQQDGILISVADSGPGVDAKIKDEIWTALYSSKIDQEGRAFGTGLGLTIVDNVVSDLGGTRTVKRDSNLRGALFEIWLPLIK